jgi:hypothetical protein
MGNWRGKGEETLKSFWILALLTVFALAALAADVSGVWKASMETPNGTMESSFTLKVDGAKLTGTMSMGQFGDSPISEGKIDGDNISFAVVRQFDGNEFRINYKGKVSGDEMKLNAEMPGMDQGFQLTAKRSK